MTHSGLKAVMVLGGYGNFGQLLCRALAAASIPLIVVGRDHNKAEGAIRALQRQCPNASVTPAVFDAHDNVGQALERFKPWVVVNTCGPFQSQDYNIARCCIAHRVHYIDLADGREFVRDIGVLHQEACDANVAVISGASTVPCLSSAVIEHYQSEFSAIDTVRYGITPGQKTERGLATTLSVLSYLGRPIRTKRHEPKQRYGWQGLYRQRYPQLGWRWMSHCDIPDLDLFPDFYQINDVQFSAGMESAVLHWGMWLASWAVRCKIPLSLTKHAQRLLALSHWFDRFGTNDGGMHMTIKGVNDNGQPKTIHWFIIAKGGDGPQIPITPALLLVKKILKEEGAALVGAQPCVGLVTLEEYIEALSPWNIKTHVDQVEPIQSEGELIKSVLKEQWCQLHPDVQNRFEKAPLPGKPQVYRGKLDTLYCSTFGKGLASLTRPFLKGALIPYCDKDCPVDVKIFSKPGNPCIFKQRIYHLNQRKPIDFTSWMKLDEKGAVLECVGAGVGMKLHLFVQDGGLHFQSGRYFIEVGKWRVPLPHVLTPGRVYLTHVNVSQAQFRFQLDITHPWFGKTFSQGGVFREVE